MKSVLRVIGLAAAVVCVVPGMAPADLLVYDGFEYTLGTDISGQGTGSGWAGNWGTNGNDTISGTVINNMALDRLVTSSNAVQLHKTGAWNAGRYYRRFDLGRNLTNGEVWVSFVYRTPFSGNAGEYQFFFIHTNGVDQTGHLFNMAPQNAQGGQASSVGNPTTFATFAAGTLQTAEKYLLVGREQLGTPSGKTTLWILRNSDLNAIAGPQVTEADLDAHYFRKAETNTAANVTISSNDYVDIAMDGSVDCYMMIDEIRIGTSASDVIPLGSEPGLLAYEGFDYTLGTELTGQGSGTGWGANTWVRQDAELSGIITNGLSFEGLAEDGEAVLISDAVPQGGWTYGRGFELDSPLESGFVWMSCLYRDPAGSVNEHQAIGITTNDFTALPWHFIAYPQFSGSFPSIQSGAWSGGSGSISSLTPNANIQDGAVYLIVVKQELDTPNGETAMWTLRESDWTNITAAAVSESDLNTHHYQKGTLNDTPVWTVSGDDGVRIYLQDDDVNPGSLILDEIRIGTGPSYVLPRYVAAGTMILVR